MPAFRISIIHSYLTSKSTNSIPTCFAEARAVFAEAILQKIAKKWHGGSSRKQIFRGRIRGSCGCVRGSYAEGFAEARPYVQQSKKEFLTPLNCVVGVDFFFWIAFNLRSFSSIELLHMVGFSQRKLPRCDSHRQQIRPLVHFCCAKCSR